MTKPLPELLTNEDLKDAPEKEAGFDILDKNYKKKIIYNDNNKQNKNFSPKVIFSALLFIALGTLAYGFYSLSSNIYKNSNVAAEQGTETVETDNLVETLVAQNKLDTDKDGLSDYEETNVYGTSPYLADTDSDGYDDKKEIAGGHDPLCPTLDNCRVDWTGKTENSANANNSNTSEQILSTEEWQALNNLSASEVRKLLISEGQISEEELSAIDDATLMQIYKESFSNTNTTTINSTAVDSTTEQTLSTEDLQTLNSLTVEEVRELLKTKGGISEEELSAIDDATLMEIYKEALAGQK